MEVPSGVPEPLRDPELYQPGEDGVPRLKAWPDGYPILRPGDRVRLSILGFPRFAALPVSGKPKWRRVPDSPFEAVAEQVSRSGWFDAALPDGTALGIWVADPHVTVENLTARDAP